MVKLRYFLLVIILIMSCGIVSADALTLLSNWSCINSSTGFVASAMGAASKDPIGGYYYLVTGGDKDSVARIYISPDGVTWYNHPNFTPGTNSRYLGAATEVYADYGSDGKYWIYVNGLSIDGRWQNLYASENGGYTFYPYHSISNDVAYTAVYNYNIDTGYEPRFWLSSHPFSVTRFSVTGLNYITGGREYSGDNWFKGCDIFDYGNGGGTYGNPIIRAEEVANTLPPRVAHTMVEFDNKLWVFGGVNTTGTNYWPSTCMNDSWYSYDGYVWYRANATNPWRARCSFEVLEYNDELLLIGGIYWTGSAWAWANDVWKSSDGITWEYVVDLPLLDQFRATPDYPGVIWAKFPCINVIDDTFYVYGTGKIYATEYASLSWDKDCYIVDENATINYGITEGYWYPLTFNYSIDILDESTSYYVATYPLTSSSGDLTITVDPDVFQSVGLYSAELAAVEKATGNRFRFTYKEASVLSYVQIIGDTIDAYNEVITNSTDVAATQLSLWYNTTSDVVDGNYSIDDSDVGKGYRIDISAFKVNYTNYPMWFTPNVNKTYNIDLYLLPENISHNGTAIGGLVLTTNYHQAISNATITLSNSTSSFNTTTSDYGWFLFDATPSGGVSYETYTTEVVDTTYDMGMYAAIAHNGSMIHAAYYDNTNKELIGAYKNGGAWTPSVTDNGTITLYDNYVYVADTGNNRIVMRDSNLVYIDKIGSLGSGDDEFNGTTGISAVANYTSLSTYVYIADTNNSRVERRFSNNLTFVDAFGTYGTGDDNFSIPQDLCVDVDGLYMWVADTGNHRIVKRFAENYTYIAQYGTYGTGTTNFSSPRGISVDPTGTYLLVADSGNSRIMKFFAQNLTYIGSVGSIGTTDNKFDTPSGIFIERSGADVFYLADTGNNRIMARKLSDLTYLRKIGTLGTGADQFNAPRDITSDGNYVYVSDSGNNRIHKRYASDFAYAITIGTSGSGDDQFSNPSGVAVTMNGSVAVDYDVGEYASLTIDDLGNEWVSFYDATNGDLITAHRHPGSDWHSYRSDSGGDVGQYTSNANYGDRVQVSYYNVTGQNLKYMSGNVSGNYTEIVDWGVGTGKYSGIALTGGGEPRISYYDETNGDLKYASKTGYTWTNQTLDSTDNVGQYTDIVIDGSGYAYISYYDVSNANLKYAYRDGTGWHTETVDSTGDVGKYTSITRSETTGYVYISYYDATNGNLKMAYYNTTSWNIVTVDSTGDVGQYTSIDLDDDGYPHILYYDVTNQQLKHAYYYISSSLITIIAPNSTYIISALKSMYVTNTTSVVSGDYDNLTIFNIFMSGKYNLTINIVDYDTNLPILQSVMVVLSDGQSTNTTSGNASFEVSDGVYSIGASSSNYKYGYETTYIDSDATITIYLEPYETYTGIDYTIAPRNVRFICVDHFGQRLNGVDVSAVGHDTTLPDWGIFSIIFGWMAAYTNASMTNDTMSGTTGSDGSVVFLMTESLQYSMAFTNSSRSISESLTLYPKDDTYVITLGTSPFAEPAVQYINITLYTSEPNSSFTTLWASYNDPNLHTTSANFTVRNASGYVLHSHVTGGSSSFTDSYTVSHVTGTQYTWGIIASQTDYGNISRYTSTTLHSRLIELGLEDMYYNWISLIFLFILIGLFSGRSVIYGYVVFPLVMGIFYFIGWLQITYVLASGVIILGIMLFLSKRQFQGEGV